MIRIQYRDVIVGGQLYCALQAQREMDTDEYAILFMVRWFGSAEIPPPSGRGELLALAGTTGVYRHEMLLISPPLPHTPDKVLAEWRQRFGRIEYCDGDLAVTNIMTAECHVLAESDERAIVDEIIIRNFSTGSSTPFDSMIISDDATNADKINNYIYVLTDKSSRILSCRRPFASRQFDELMAQAIAHDLSVYCSPCKLDGKHVVAEGPWIAMSPKSSHTPSPEASLSVIIPSSIEIASTPENDEANWDGIIQTKDGKLMCPYCQRGFKSRAGLTNHVKSVHADQLDDYRIRNDG